MDSWLGMLCEYNIISHASAFSIPPHPLKVVTLFAHSTYSHFFKHLPFFFNRATDLAFYILTTNLAACVCLCVRKILPISPLTLLFRLQTSRKFCSHSKIPIRCLWTAFCVPLSFIFYEKRWFIMQIVTLRRSRFAAVWQMDNSRNPFSRRGWMASGQREK